MKILLSIKPKYVKKIVNGKKQFEFRRKIFKRRDVDTVVVYETKPIGKVIGEFEIKKVLSDTPIKIWNKTSKYAGLSKKEFFNYFNGIDEAFAIQISHFTSYTKEIELNEFKNGKFKAPQSFIYLNNKA